MFRRKSTADVEGEVCPYCEFVNVVGAVTCSQCYYQLNKAPRDQGEPISVDVSNSIFDELMSDDDDSWEEGEALEVVLTLDQDPLEVGQYEATNFESEEPEKIGFMESSSPEMHDTVSHKPVEVSAEDVGEKIKNVPKIEFAKKDPFDEVPEPVHQGKGALFSPSTSVKMDDDLLGHVGGSELPSLPPDDLYENKVDLTIKKAPAPTPAMVLPNLPDIPDTAQSDVSAYSQTTPTEKIDVPAPAEDVVQDVVQAQSEVQGETPLMENVETAATSDDSVTDKAVSQPEREVTPPSVVLDNRIWPWPKGEAWDARQVHREVVSALEQVKSGKMDEASATIDALGPHLTDENVDLIYHIGMVLKQLNRIDEVKSMLTKANEVMPGNQHVTSATAHLGV